MKNENAEKSLIGSYIANPKLLYNYRLPVDAFYFNHTRNIYKAILELFESGGSVDPVSIADKIPSFKISAYIGLSDFDGSYPLVRSIYEKRRLSEALTEALNNISTSDNVNEVMEDLYKAYQKINIGKACIIPISKIIPEVNRKIEKSISEDIQGVTSGFNHIDRTTGGWKTGLHILAARPSMGKSAFMLCNAIESAKRGKNAVLFSLEMSYISLGTRAVSIESEIDLEDIRKGKVEWGKYHDNINDLSNSKLYICDDSYKLTDITLECKRMASKGLDIVFIDYLQLIEHKSKGRSRENEVTEVSRSLKKLSKDINCPVVCLCQLNRSVENRASKVPLLGDLRESGAIEQDADTVSFIFRPEYYDIREYKGMPTDGLAVFMLAKNREGATKDFYLTFEKEKTKFIENHETPQTDYSPF